MQIFAAIQEYAWRIFWIGAILTVLEFLIPQVRYPLVTRLRGLLFWSVYILITASALTIFSSMWATLGVRPLLVLHVGEWFNYSNYTHIAGLIAAPVLAGILAEFFYYWFHRMQHAVPFFWRFHSVHHSLREMNAWNSNHHFTEEIFRIPFVTLPLSLIISGDPGPVPLVVASILAMQGLYEHSTTKLGLGPIRYIISDNKYHRLHHSIETQHWNKNFGSFTPVWDILFGTARFTLRNEWPETGIPDQDEPKTIADFLVRPFKGLSPRSGSRPIS
jgi:sterol desaturase/sphingolipid hydroxylase (fatty acid hydroxylase superfamily)